MKSKFSILTALLLAADSMSAAVLEIDGVDKSSLCNGGTCTINSSNLKSTNDSQIVLNDCTHKLTIKDGSKLSSIIVKGTSSSVLDNFTIEQNVIISNGIENQVRIKQIESNADMSFTNAQNAVVEQGILINKGIATISNAGIIQNAQAQTGQIGFGNQSPKANIKSWAITLNSNAADFNSLKNAKAQNPSAFGHILVQGLSDGTLQNNNRGTISVENSAIKVGVGSGFVPGEKYEIKNVIVDLDKNQAAEASAINNGVGLKAVHFTPASPSLNLTITDSTISGTNTAGGSGNTSGTISAEISPLNSPAAQSAKATIANTTAKNHFVGNIVSSAVSSAQTSTFSQIRANLDSNNLSLLAKEEYSLKNLPHFAAAIKDNQNAKISKSEILQNSTSKPFSQQYSIFAMPYFANNKVEANPSNLSGNSYGIILGAQNATNYGVFGLFAGYENGKLNSETIEQKGSNIYFGANFQKDLTIGIHPTFIRTIANFSIQEQDLNIESAQKTKINSNAISAEAAMGLNFGHIQDKGALSPEISAEWSRFYQKGYEIAFANTAAEKYDSITHNFIYLGAALAYEKELNEQFSLNAKLGAKFNLNRKVKVALSIANVGVSEKINYPSTYAFAHIGANYAPSKNTQISLNYDGVLSSDAQTHSIWAKFGFYF